MNLILRRALFKKKESLKPNLAIETDFTTQFDHLAGRAGTGMDGKSNMIPNNVYHVVCDVEIVITDVQSNKIFMIRLGGYGPWHNVAAFGTYGHINSIGTYKEKVDYTGEFFGNPNRWCQINCGGYKGSVRLYNVFIEEA